MKKIITLLLIIALFIASLSLFACTGGDEKETEGSKTTEAETVDDRWELGGVPLG